MLMKNKVRQKGVKRMEDDRTKKSKNRIKEVAATK
jgi:hypothetical protein